jgi:hypothetical protein
LIDGTLARTRTRLGNGHDVSGNRPQWLDLIDIVQTGRGMDLHSQYMYGIWWLRCRDWIILN